MPISPTSSYRLIYAQAPFAANTAFLAGLRSRFPTVEVPYLDVSDLPEEALEAVDQYLYVLNDGDAARTVQAVKAAAARGRAFPARLEDLGVVSGREVAGMLDRFRRAQQTPTEVGSYYRVLSGRYRNLIVRMTSRDPAALLAEGLAQLEDAPDLAVTPQSVVVEYTMFEQRRPLIIERTNLTPTRTPVDPNSAFTNYLATARARKAVILDADTELREACCRCDNLYTRPDPDEVARAVLAGEPAPQWGRYVGGSQGFYFTVSRFRLLYAEYELHVVFDERPGGPRAGQGSQAFQEAYRQNRNWVKRFVRACGLHVYDKPGDRAEDVIGSLAKRMTGDLGYSDVLIATKGTDYYPLVSDKVKLTLPKVNFRDHPQTITVPDALAKFGLSEASQLPRIYWLRALTGDVAGTPSVNLFNKHAGHAYTNIRPADYLPHVLAATDLKDLKLRLLAFEAFHPFVDKGQFDANLAALSLDTALLDEPDSFDGFRIQGEDGMGKVDPDEIRDLLEENSFYKEIEYLEWTMRVIRGMW